ncbi:MAG: hypothetical protein R2786_00205 [Flavobacteriaceae bacterium]
MKIGSLLYSLLFLSISAIAQFDTTKLNGAASSEPVKFGIVTSSSPSNFARINSYGAIFNDGNGELTADTVGSPYFYDTYKIGSVIKDSIVVIENIAIRYNVYNDIFIGKINLITIEDEAKTIIKSEEFKIKIGSTMFVALPSPENSNSLQYYQLLTTGGKGTLYKKNEKIYKPRVMATTSLTRDVPPAFKDRETYYFKDINGAFSEIPSSKKKILELFGDFKKQMTEFVKENKLNSNDEKDLITIFKHYESL